MTLDKLTGVYFDETVSTVVNDIEPTNEILQFIVQTSSTIASLDDQLVLTNLSSFKTAVSGKGLTNTTDMIEYLLNATGHTKFYVYSVKTDTDAGWQAAVTTSQLYKEVKKVIYLEETASSNSFKIENKMASMITGCATCATYGAFRIAYVIPAGTINAAITAASSTPAETTLMTTFSSIMDGIHNGRLCVVLPDNYKNIMATIAIKEYFEEVGYGDIYGEISELTYKLTKEQVLALRNLGVIVPRVRYVEGTWHYEIELGVTTNWNNDKADGLLVARTITDELLRDVDNAVRPFVKEAEHEANEGFVQTAVDNVVATYVKNKYVKSDGTKLSVADTGNLSFNITGGVKPTRTLAVINVSTNLS